MSFLQYFFGVVKKNERNVSRCHCGVRQLGVTCVKDSSESRRKHSSVVSCRRLGCSFAFVAGCSIVFVGLPVSLINYLDIVCD